AGQLQQQNQKIFYIERMQPDSLRGKPARQHYTRITVGLIFSVLGIVWLEPLWGSTLTNHVIKNINPILLSGLALLLVLVNGALLGLVNGVLYQRQAEKVSGTQERQKWK